MGLDESESIKSRRIHFHSFIKRFKNTPIKELSTSELNEWFQETKKERHLSDKTLLSEQIITTNPLTNIKFKRNSSPKKHRCILNHKELHEFTIKAKIHDPEILYPLLYAVIQTGARRSEILNLKWENVDLEHGLIVFAQTKNGSDRKLRITRNLITLLKHKLKISNYVFPDEKGNQIGRMKIQRLIKKFKQEHTFEKNWQLHDFRHSFANNFLKKGGEMYQLQAILGHKSIQMTVDLYGNLKSHDIEESSPYDF